VAARLRRTAAWALLPAGIWLAIRAARRDAWRPVALTPVQEWQHGWSHLAAINLTRAFVLLAPFAVPAGLVLAALAWAWRIYAITTGLGGIMATAPITFDARQWKRQVRTAKGLTGAPGAVPLLARGGRIPVGGTIRAIGPLTLWRQADRRGALAGWMRRPGRGSAYGVGVAACRAHAVWASVASAASQNWVSAPAVVAGASTAGECTAAGMHRRRAPSRLAMFSCAAGDQALSFSP